MINVLDGVLVEFVSAQGHPLAIPASRIQRLGGFVTNMALSGYSVEVANGATVFVDGDENGYPLKGTYAENLAIWRKAVAPVTMALYPKIVFEADSKFTSEPGQIVPVEKP